MADITAPAPIAAAASPPCPPQLIPIFPDDISLQILARVPRFNHPFLSLVSKSWRAAVKSADLFRTRSLLRTAQSSLYLSLRVESSFLWYTQVTNPQIPKSAVIPVSSIPQRLVGSSILSIGPKIYVIGGSVNDIPSNNVWIFDCRFNKWETGPRMRAAREFSAAGEYGGRIFVMGGCVVDNWARSINWAESFDPATGLWSPVPSTAVEVRDKWMHASTVIGCKFYGMADRGGVVYDVVTGEWAHVPKRLDLGWRGRATEIDGVLYCYDYLGKIRGYDVGSDAWKELRGVEKGLPKFLCSSTMVNLDGRLCVLWEGNGNGKTVDIMCAEIEVARSVDGGLMGTIVRVDVMLVVPKGATISHCLAVEF